VIVAHNVLPHEPTAGARRLVAALARAIDGVMVHSNEEAASAALHLSCVAAVQRPLPPFGPALGTTTTRPAAHADEVATPSPGAIRLLALGFVRRYKGLDLLLEAARHAPAVTITIRGECWDDDLRRELEQLAALPELAGRVDLRTGYVDAPDIDQLFATHDLAVLPYLEATGSQNVLLAFTHGLPVLVSDLSTLSNAVTDSVDGKVLPVADTAAWAAALASLTPDTVAQWRANVTVPDSSAAWTEYCRALTSFSKVHQ
jgi:glycosyltransferase involved in cell wall biosynthesis